MRTKVCYSDGDIREFEVYKTKVFPEYIKLYRVEDSTKKIKLTDIEQILHFE